jgi:hypothetical protein
MYSGKIVLETKYSLTMDCKSSRPNFKMFITSKNNYFTLTVLRVCVGKWENLYYEKG